MRPLKCVHALDGVVLHHVIHVAAQQDMRVDRVVQRGVECQILLGEQIAAAQRQFSTARMPASVERDVAPVFVEREVQALLQTAHHAVGDAGQHLFIGLSAGQHQRNARFVDQDGIGLVDHGRVERRDAPGLPARSAS